MEVRPARLGLDLRDWPGRQLLRHPLAEADEGHPPLAANRQPEGRPAPAGHRKIESTVRYLGIEVDDALAIAEQVDV